MIIEKRKTEREREREREYLLQLKAELLIKECKIVVIAKLKKVGLSKPI